jgi:hypothetical protein
VQKVFQADGEYRHGWKVVSDPLQSMLTRLLKIHEMPSPKKVHHVFMQFLHEKQWHRCAGTNDIYSMGDIKKPDLQAVAHKSLKCSICEKYSPPMLIEHSSLCHKTILLPWRSRNHGRKLARTSPDMDGLLRHLHQSNSQQFRHCGFVWYY